MEINAAVMSETNLNNTNEHKYFQESSQQTLNSPDSTNTMGASVTFVDKEYQDKYDCDRIAEFVGRAASILNNGLQQGFAKGSKGKSPLFLGQCPYRLFIFFMKLHPCNEKKRILDPMGDRVRVNVVRRYFLFDKILADLDGWSWYIRHHGQIKSWNGEDLCTPR
jgi:hypothetical protein